MTFYRSFTVPAGNYVDGVAVPLDGLDQDHRALYDAGVDALEQLLEVADPESEHAHQVVISGWTPPPGHAGTVGLQISVGPGADTLRQADSIAQAEVEAEHAADVAQSDAGVRSS